MSVFVQLLDRHVPTHLLMRRRLVVLFCGLAVIGVGGRGFGALAGGAPGAGAPAAADPATVPGYDRDPLSLLGPSRLTAAQLAALVRDGHHPRITVSIDELAQIYVEEGNALGVRADMAWAQSIVETGWFGFRGSMVQPDDNNFSGLGACDSCSRGRLYASARLGVRAQMQLLRGYADPHPPHGYSMYPPKSYRGIAPTWWQMGNGHWATSTRYASAVISMYGRMLDFAHISLSYSPPPGAALGPLGTAATSVVDGPPPEPPTLAGQGLYLADVQGQVYDVGDARFWGSAFSPSGKGGPVAIAATPTADGYWLFMTNGDALAFGAAQALGGPGVRVAAAAGAPHGQGYWTVTAAGVVRAFGSAAKIAPEPGSIAAGARIVGIAATRTGSGYWLVDSLGRVVAVGDARSFGSLRDASVKDPVVGLAATPWDDGYWLATASGRVVGFGAAKAMGSLADDLADNTDYVAYPTAAKRKLVGILEASQHLVVAIRPTPTGGGYWLVTADGLVVGRGDAPDFGDVQQTGVPVLAVTSRIDTAPPFRPHAN
jgi:hypothetical protein